MADLRFAIHRAPGETRAAALDPAGQAVSLFIERWDGVGEPARLGDLVAARLRSRAPKEGGAFFEAGNSEAFFVRGELPAALTEGVETQLEILAEARRGKLARAILANNRETGTETGFSALERWARAFPGGGATLQFDDGFDAREAIDKAFDEALLARVGLAGGGHLEISRTAALIAMDIDSSGRQSKGSAGARAFAINREAVREAARQMALRNLGGLLVIDCIAPLNADAGQKLRAGFIEAFSSVSGRSCEALRPSRFGLLEAKIAWGPCPIEDRLKDETGKPTAETELLDLLRLAERETEGNRTAFFSLALSSPARNAYIARRDEVDRILQSRFAGRVVIASETSDESSVRRV